MEKLKELNELRKALKKECKDLRWSVFGRGDEDTELRYNKLNKKLKKVKKEIYKLIETL